MRSPAATVALDRLCGQLWNSRDPLPKLACRMPVRRKARAMRSRRDDQEPDQAVLTVATPWRPRGAEVSTCIAATCGAVTAGTVAKELRQQIGVRTELRRPEPRLAVLRQPVRARFPRAAARQLRSALANSRANRGTTRHPASIFSRFIMLSMFGAAARRVGFEQLMAISRRSGVHNKSPAAAASLIQRKRMARERYGKSSETSSGCADAPSGATAPRNSE